MQTLTGWIPLLPFLGFLTLVSAPLLSRREMPESLVAIIGVGSVGLAALLTAAVALPFFIGHPQAFTLNIANWISAGGLSLSFTLHVDALTAVMLAIITGVGLLIHLYSSGYMRGDDGYRRFFAYMNLFVAAMLVLVLADNLVLLYLGWEGVGLCSYLLIGFWYRDPANGAAARKAFVVTRIGDTAMAVGLFLLFTEFATLDIPALMQASRAPDVDQQTITLAALLLLGGAVGKSAQLPLQTWLPDAMAGPTPVSALIHAATMVTAGVYLVARTHELFLRSDLAMISLATIGTLTVLLAGCSALVQSDLKRVLAYSTISQLGYMFLALGVGAWSAAIFHLMTHAFFKALLFLSAGSVILSLHHEQNIFAMGALAKKIPFTFICFATGCACLAALPLTSGFFSKDQILLQAWEYFEGFNLIWLGGILGAAITALYSIRVLYLVFLAEPGSASAHCRSANTLPMQIPLFMLTILALAGGALAPALQDVFGEDTAHQVPHWAEWLAIATPVIAVTGGWLWWRGREKTQAPIAAGLADWWKEGWGFDRIYNTLLVAPVCWITQINRHDILDKIYRGISALSLQLNLQASRSQTGQLRWYLTTLVAGSILVLAIMVVL